MILQIEELKVICGEDEVRGIILRRLVKCKFVRRHFLFNETLTRRFRV